MDALRSQVKRVCVRCMCGGEWKTIEQLFCLILDFSRLGFFPLYFWQRLTEQDPLDAFVMTIMETLQTLMGMCGARR